MKKRVLSALLALCLTLSLAGAAFAENETPVTTASPAPVGQTLDENSTESTEPAVSDADSNNSVSSDETQDDAVAGSDSSDSNSTGTSSDEVDDVTSDSMAQEDTVSNADSTPVEGEDGAASTSEGNNDALDNTADEEAKPSGSEETTVPSADADGENEDTASSAVFAETRATKNSFHIKWGNYFNVKVEYVDQNGNLLGYNFGYSDQTLDNSNTLTFANYAPESFEVENGIYSFDCARYESVNGSMVTTLSASEDSEWWGKRYYYTLKNENQTVKSLSYSKPKVGPSSSKQTATVCMVYNFTKAEPEPQDLYISDTVAKNGLFTATFQDGILSGGEEITYTWYRSLSNEKDWEEVTAQKVTGDHYNWDTSTPQQINVAYDALLKDAKDAQRYYYKVVATVKSDNGTSTEYTATKQVPYYIQLQNGSFETPDVPEDQFNMQWPNGTEDLIWQTTGPGSINNKPGQDIEVIEEGHGDTRSNYGVNVASEGEQFAELNCEAYGALYQDVMTIPGSTLNWSFDHLARDLDKQSRNANDTMALVIMPESEADAVAQQLSEAAKSSNPASAISTILQKLKEKGVERGYFVEEVTDSTYSVEGDWQTHEGTYEVPDGQYLTRFFFVSVDAAYDHRDNASHFGTVGNLLDAVWFSTKVKPAADDEAKLIVSKTVTGLESIDGYSVTMTVYDGSDSQDIVLNNFTSDGNGNYTASGSITYNVPANDGSKTLTVTESAPNVTGYTLDSTAYAVTEEGSDSQTGSGTTVSNVVVNAAHTKTVAFTNTYAKDEPPEALDHHKQAVLIDDPTDPNYGDGYNYKLSLDVIGDTSSTSTSTDLNVLMIIDKSTSMNDMLDGKSKISTVKTAAENLVDQLETNAGLGTITYNIVEFECKDRTKSTLNWVANGQQAKNAISEIKTPSGGKGTNWEAGIRQAITELGKSDKPNAKTCVIFFTDGEPNRYLDDYSVEKSSDDNNRCAREAAAAAADINVDYFFGIGAFGQNSSNNKTRLESVVEASQATTKQTVVAASANDILKAFSGIASSITTGYYDVTISDTLSENVEFVLKDDAPQFEITVTDANGNDVTAAEQAAGMAVSVARDGDQFSWSLGGDYMLKDGYTYTLSVIITPSDAAKQKYATNGAYPDTPDAGTGTHAETSENGFYSNGQATLSYKHSSWSEKLSDEYQRPVVQVPEVGNLVINKEVVGTTVTSATYSFEIATKLDMTGANPKINGEAVTFTKEEDGWTATVGLQATTKNGVDGTVTITGLPIGSYTVTEKTDAASLPPVAGYHWVNVVYEDTNKTYAEVQVTADTANPATVAVTNNYEHDDVTLTVTKTVSGTMGDTSAENKFDFKLILTKEDGTPYTLEDGAENDLKPVEGEDGQYIFQLASGEDIRIDLPYGVKAKVEETDRSDYTEKSRQYQTGAETLPNYTEVCYQERMMTGNYTFDFENIRDVVAPTGLEDNHTKPFGLMVGVAVMAGLALAGGAVVRRRRRWME